MGSEVTTPKPEISKWIVRMEFDKRPWWALGTLVRTTYLEFAKTTTEGDALEMVAHLRRDMPDEVYVSLRRG